MNRHDFWLKMRSMYPKCPDDYGLREYNERLTKRNLTAAELDRLYEWLTDNCEYFPALARFIEGCNLLNLGHRKTGRAAVWQRIRFGNVTRYRKIADPACPPELPEGGTNYGLVIPPELCYDDEQPCSREDGKEAFAAAFVEAGGELSKLKVMQRIVDPPQSNIRQQAVTQEYPEPVFAGATDDDIPF